MRFSRLFLIFAVFLLAGPRGAQAKSFLDWVFTPAVPDFGRVYHEDGKIPHLSVREKNPQLIQDWITVRGGKEALLRDLYADDVIRDQYESDGVQVLEVGKNFMRLSGQDRQHIAEFIDYAYGITSSSPDGMFMLEHWRSGEPIGIYTKYGLQLQ
jgi:hypothetical protein